MLDIFNSKTKLTIIAVFAVIAVITIPVAYSATGNNVSNTTDSMKDGRGIENLSISIKDEISEYHPDYNFWTDLGIWRVDYDYTAISEDNQMSKVFLDKYYLEGLMRTDDPNSPAVFCLFSTNSFEYKWGGWTEQFCLFSNSQTYERQYLFDSGRNDMNQDFCFRNNQTETCYFRVSFGIASDSLNNTAYLKNASFNGMMFLPQDAKLTQIYP